MILSGRNNMEKHRHDITVSLQTDCPTTTANDVTHTYTQVWFVFVRHVHAGGWVWLYNIIYTRRVARLFFLKGVFYFCILIQLVVVGVGGGEFTHPYHWTNSRIFDTVRWSSATSFIDKNVQRQPVLPVAWFGWFFGGEGGVPTILGTLKTNF